MSRKPQEWDEKFADFVYNNVEKHKCFITNLGKCTQIDARVLPNSVYNQYPVYYPIGNGMINIEKTI